MRPVKGRSCICRLISVIAEVAEESLWLRCYEKTNMILRPVGNGSQDVFLGTGGGSAASIIFSLWFLFSNAFSCLSLEAFLRLWIEENTFLSKRRPFYMKLRHS